PGWTLPGVMSVGAAQIMTNVHRVKPGNKGIIIGIDVLASAIAMELKIADIDVEAIALPASSKTTSLSSDPLTVMDSLLHVSHMAPSKFIQYGSKLMKNDFFKKCGIQFYPKKGVKMWDIPVMLRQAVIEIYGDEVVEGVKVAIITKEGHDIPGTEKKISVDFVCIAGGLYPLAELVALTGSPFYNIPELGGHVPLHNEEMETSVKGLYVAGNITGIEGAKVAIITKEGHVIPGTEKRISVDFVCVAGGLYPLAELVALTGSPFYNIPELGGHVPLHNEEMETSVKGLYVAGNITGIEGAKVAISQGKV